MYSKSYIQFKVFYVLLQILIAGEEVNNRPRYEVQLSCVSLN